MFEKSRFQCEGSIGPMLGIDQALLLSLDQFDNRLGLQI